MQHFQVIPGKWLIAIRHCRELLLVEVTDEIDAALFREILWLMYEEYPFLIISQYIDTSQWKLGDRSEFLDRLSEKHGVEISLTSTYLEAEAPDANSSIFVMNVRGSPTPQLLEDTTRFGMTNLPNIIYGLQEESTNWRLDLLKWNRQILNWFNLISRIDSKEFVELITLLGLITMTIDGHLNFCFTGVSRLDRLLSILEAVAKRKKLELEIRSMDMKQ